MEDLKGKDVNVNYSFEKVGKYKRNNWSFQREWRYIITVSPMGLKEMTSYKYKIYGNGQIR